MNLPDTTARKPRSTKPVWPMLLLVVSIVIVSGLLLAALVGGRGFSPGEDITSASIEEVSASLEDTAYPPRDILAFEGGAGTIFVYLSVTDLESPADLSVDVRRESSESFFGRLTRGASRIDVSGGGEDQLAPSENGVSGVIKFEVRAAGGGELPLGNYTITVTENGEEAAEKRFVVRE